MEKLPRFDEIQFEISAMLELDEGELTVVQREKLDEYLEMLGTQESERIDRFGAFVRGQAARIQSIRDEAARLYRKAAAAETRLKYLKGSYLRTFQLYGLKQVRGMVYSASIRKTQSVEIVSPEATLDAGFASERVEIVPDKQRIKDAINAGQDVPGARLIEKENLVIR